jgi:hypothetical protein
MIQYHLWMPWIECVSSICSSAGLTFRLSQILDSHDIDDKLRRRCTTTLRKICGLVGILPTSHTLPSGLEVTGNGPHASGGFADVWQGNYNDRVVAIKALRACAADDFNKLKKVGFLRNLRDVFETLASISFSVKKRLFGNVCLMPISFLSWERPPSLFHFVWFLTGWKTETLFNTSRGIQEPIAWY